MKKVIDNSDEDIDNTISFFNAQLQNCRLNPLGKAKLQTLVAKYGSKVVQENILNIVHDKSLLTPLHLNN